MKELTLQDIEKLCEKLEFPSVQNLGNGLYKIMPMGVICGEKFLEKFNEEVRQLSKEYNTNTSAEHPVMDDDIVRTIEKSIESKDKEP